MHWTCLLLCQREGVAHFRARMSWAAAVVWGVELAWSGMEFLG